MFYASEMRIPESIVAALTHDIFIRGCQINYTLNSSKDVEICSLYPETPFRPVDECFQDFVTKALGVANVVENKPKGKDGILATNSKPAEALVITAQCA